MSKLSPMPIFVKTGYGVSARQGVKFWPFPLTCAVAITTLSLYYASV